MEGNDVKAEPTVYIILLNWHGWRDTIACLDSLASLDYTNYRVLVVDNGSTDDSVARIRAAHPEAPIIETGRNLGFSGGCNVGVRHALEEGTDYIWLLNNDTTVDFQALSAMVAVAEANPRVGAIGSVLYYLDNPKDIQAWGGGRVCFWSGRTRHHLGPVPGARLHYLTAASILLRRRALEEVGLLDENTFFMYWEDTDFSFRLRKAGWHLAVADQSIVLHREHAATGKGSPLLDYYFNESAVRFFRRYASIPAWPISIGVLGRLAKRVLRGNLPGFVSTLRGTYAGLGKNR
ncbi:MAG: glycosyltransferase family 2 protein [Acidithiobacillus sp.]|nr:glycosyltransferase family 2 protein [Acidithiobacillus sp.]